MQTVIETRAFINAAKDAGMTDEEREVVIDLVGGTPDFGVVMKETGGCRKFRFKKPGSGKSGGYRVVTYFGGGEIPVVLLTVFGKNEKDNLTKAERNELRKLVVRLDLELREWKS